MKKLKFSAVAVIMCLGAFTFCACGGKENAEPVKSGLVGTFTYQETLGASEENALRITHNAQTPLTGRNYLLSTVAPLNYGLEGVRVSYNMDQRLSLKRDYTYKYEYSVVLSNPGDWGNRFANFAVSITGTFTYERLKNESAYSVELSDPSAGTLTVYGTNIGDPNNIYTLSLHDNADLVINYGILNGLGEVDYGEYACGRIVTVDKESKQLSDDVFFPEIMNYIMKYSTY